MISSDVIRLRNAFNNLSTEDQKDFLDLLSRSEKVVQEGYFCGPMNSFAKGINMGPTSQDMLSASSSSSNNVCPTCGKIR